MNDNADNKNEMNHLYLTFVFLGLLLFGCTKADNKINLTINEKLVDTTKTQTLKLNNPPKDEQLEKYKIDFIKNIIALFKEKNIDKISNKIEFPLYREYPMPAIKDKDEFKLRFNEVFDKILIDQIANSKIDQWSEVGWRGIMLDNGIIWISSSDGILTMVNYHSDFEKKLMKNLIDKDKENLHISLKTFKSPTYKIKTKNYLIRIDELTNHKYRYASWKISEKESSKPDLIIDNGEIEFQGSGGNHVITFLKNDYIYRIFRNIMREDEAPDITLEIEKDGKIILTQDGKLDE